MARFSGRCKSNSNSYNTLINRVLPVTRGAKEKEKEKAKRSSAILFRSDLYNFSAVLFVLLLMLILFLFWELFIQSFLWILSLFERKILLLSTPAFRDRAATLAISSVKQWSLLRCSPLCGVRVFDLVMILYLFWWWWFCLAWWWWLDGVFSASFSSFLHFTFLHFFCWLTDCVFSWPVISLSSSPADKSSGKVMRGGYLIWRHWQ